MNYTNRQKKILLFLNQNSEQSSSVISGKEIASHMQISLRTLQNEISNINHSSAAPVILSNNKGYYLDRSVLRTLRLTPQTSESDEDQLLKLLLLDKNSYDLDELAEDLYLSTSTLLQKFKKLTPTLQQYDLLLERQKNRISIRGTESQKRHLIHDMIMREIGLTCNSLEIASSYFKNINTVEIQSIILSVIQQHEFFIENCYTTNLIINIFTAFARISNHYPSEEVSLPDYESIPEYHIASDICQETAKRFQMAFTHQDICYITLLIMGQIKPVSEEKNITKGEKEQSEILIQIIHETFQAYMLNMDYNSFLPNFIRHLQALIIRAKNRQFVINLITENIRETSPFVYDVAVHLAKRLEDQFAISVIDEEIGLLSIYIGFIIEKSSCIPDAVKVLILCNDYKNISSRILKNLKLNHSDYIDIIDVITNPLDVYKYPDAELIIHTQPIHTINQDSVLISPFYSQNDEEKVADALTRLRRHKRLKQNLDLLKTYFNENLYFQNLGIGSKEDAIRFLGKHVEDIGLCKPGFTQSVIKRESMSSTCFMESFAIPHALELNAERTCFAVLIEKNGIQWDSHRIHCVFLIAVCREDRKEFMEIYSGIIQFLLQKDAIKQLTQSTDFNHFISCFQSFD